MFTLVLIGLALTVGYLLFCLVSPYRNCTTCKGSRRVTGSFNRVRHCTRCDSAGLQLRPGRRFIDGDSDSQRRHRDRF